MIQFNDVSFGYTKKKPIYANIQLELTAGSVYGLLGKNGAGKSTLLKLMAGLIYPQKGHLNVFDANPSKRDPSFLNHVFFIPEEIDTPNIDVLEFSAQLMPFYPKFNQEQFLVYLKEFDIPLTKMNNMSFGQKKKVWIALGMASNASLIILDEPTNGLDIPSKRKLRKLIASVINEDKCIIISTHQIKDVDSLIDKVILVDEGEIIANTDIETITEKLLFEVSNELSQNETILYHESSLVGHFIVKKRTTEAVTTKLDLELFFNACINNKIEIKALFN
ncbi:MAG: ABC transporter ATP-binding protein [Sediminibacterium sp.]|jgi:ABC-2 type transport system ATP-binding protein|nr:MAG: ABC transporter ATP-binding protein [Sediminibacterium sp.] [Sediminibacterium sp. FEMGT703S]